MDRSNFGGQIRVHKVEKGRGSVGCDPRGVQVFYKENPNIHGNPNADYLTALLKKHGLNVTAGASASDTPLRYLCVGKNAGTVSTDDVLAVLRGDPEIDMSSVNLPEGRTTPTQ